MVLRSLKSYNLKLKNHIKIVLLIISLIIVQFSVLFEQRQINNNVLESSIVEYVETIDGDTAKFIIDNELTMVRFLAIDTPESVHPTIDVEPYGIESSNRTKELLESAVSIVLEYEDDKIDYYDRTLAWIFIDGRLLQEILIEEGLGEVKYEKEHYKYVDLLYKAQQYAVQNKLNIWSK